MISKIKIFTLCVLLMCSGCDTNMINSSDNIRQLLKSNLTVESNNQEIVKFMKSLEWVYDFNQYSNRFEAGDPKEDKYPRIFGRNQIYIYVDEQGYFVRAEVVKHFGSWL